MKTVRFMTLAAVCLAWLAAPPDCQALWGWRTRKSALNSGRFALEDGIYDTARHYLRQALERSKSDKDKAEVVVWLVQAYHGERDFKNMGRTLKNYWDRSRETRYFKDLVYLKALHEFEIGKLQQALDTMQAENEALSKSTFNGAAHGLRARILLRLDKPEQALAEFEAYHRENPDAPHSAHNLLEWGGVLLELNRPNEAISVLNELIKHHPRSPESTEARLWLGKNLVLLGRRTEALPHLQGLTMDMRIDEAYRARAWFTLAEAYTADTNFSEAISALQQVEKLALDRRLITHCKLMRGKLLVQSDKEEEGIALLRKTAQDHHDSPLVSKAQLDLAELFLKNERFEDAVREYQLYLESFTDREGLVLAHKGKGWALLGLKRYVEAALHYEKAADLAQTSHEKAEALFKAADAYFLNTQYEKAHAVYDSFQQRFPGENLVPQALLQKAECYSRIGEYEKAEKILLNLEAAHADSPCADASAIKRAAIREQTHQWDQALKLYEEYLELFPKGAYVAKARHARGMIHYRLEHLKEAMADFDEIIAKHPASIYAEHAGMMRGWCYYLMGQNEKALEESKRFITEHPASTWAEEVLFWLGEYHFNNGQYAEAETHFLCLARQHPEGKLIDDALFWAARSAIRLKENQRAKEHLNHLIKNYPDSPKLAEALFAKADIHTLLNSFDVAILVFDEIIHHHQNHYLYDNAWGRKGDCHFTLGNTNELERYEKALICYRHVQNSPTASRELKLQAGFKIGYCEELLGHQDLAFQHYMDVVYEHQQERSRGQAGSPVYFTRAAFNAAAIMEKQEKWREAYYIYKRLAEAKVYSSKEAEKKMLKIKKDHWLWL